MSYNPRAAKMLQDELDKFVGLRHESARSHVESLAVVQQVSGRPVYRSIENAAFASFLSGWDAAMKLRLPELAEENHELHSRLFDVAMEKVKQQVEGNQ